MQPISPTHPSPPNASQQAFEALIASLNTTAADLLANTTLLTPILSYHVVPGVAATAASLYNAQVLPTLLTGKSITVSKPPAGPTGAACFGLG